MSSGSFSKQAKILLLRPISLYQTQGNRSSVNDKMNYSSEINEILDKARSNCNNTFYPEIIGGKLCELVFDGFMCWPQTPAGILANQSCSNKYVNGAKKGFATKQCDENGQWLIPDGFTKHWTNYSACGNFTFIKQSLDDKNIYIKWVPIIKNITQFGYILSTIFLITALFVFIHIKRLHCARNKLHGHLFVSFVVRALMSLIKDGLFVKGIALAHDVVYVNGEPQFIKENYSWVCKAIVSLRNYFIISNYMFILMETAYLHNLLFLKLFSENGVTIYYTLGWGLPIFFVIPWIILKSTNENNYCWTQKSSTYIALLIEVPIGLIVIINFVLFVIIMRILFVKLTSMYIQQRRTKYQKLARATLILVPLFGIPYTLSFGLSFYATKDQTFEILWLFFDQTFIAFQGLFVSLVYCLLNSEVQMEIVRKYNSFKDRNTKEFKRRTRTISHTQQIPLNEEMQEIPQNFGNKEQLLMNKTSDYF